MAGLNVGSFGNFPGQPQNTGISNPQQAVDTNRSPQWGRRRQGMDTGPSMPQQRWQGRGGEKPTKPAQSMGGGINVGRTSNMGILPSAQDPYRTYGSVNGGRMTPPSNPYGQNQPINFTPGGTYGNPGSMMNPSGGMDPRGGQFGGGGPIQTGPSYWPGGVTGNMGGGGNPYLERGGFTGGGMPPGIGSDTSGGIAYHPPTPPGQSPWAQETPSSTGYYNPQTRIPNMNQGGGMFGSGGFGGRPMGGGNMGMGGFRGAYRNNF